MSEQNAEVISEVIAEVAKRTVSVTGSYATGEGKSGFAVSITAELSEPKQVDAMLEEGLTSVFYRAGNSVLDKAFAPKKADGKPDTKGFKRNTVMFNAANAELVRATLEKFFAEAKITAVVGVTEKTPGEEKADGIKMALKQVEAWMVGKTPEQVTAAIEKLEASNPEHHVTYDNGKVNLESFARLLKAETARLAAGILG